MNLDVTEIMVRALQDEAPREFTGGEVPAHYASVYLAGIEERHGRFIAAWFGMDAGQSVPVVFQMVHN